MESRVTLNPWGRHDGLGLERGGGRREGFARRTERGSSRKENKG
jgi:hypothetical protein